MDQPSNSMMLIVLGLIVVVALIGIFGQGLPEIGTQVMETLKSKISAL